MAVDFDNRIDDSIVISNQVDDSVVIDLSSVSAVRVPMPTVLQDKEITPSTSKQVVSADDGFDGLGVVTVEAVTPDIDIDIQPEDIREGVDILGVVGTLEAREDLDSEFAEQESLLAELESGVGELPDKPFDKLQYKCDNLKTLEYEFYVRDYNANCTDENVTELMRDLDTSQVKYMSYMFAGNQTNTKAYKDLSSINLDLSSCIDMSYMYYRLQNLIKPATMHNLHNSVNILAMYRECNSIEEIDLSIFKGITLTEIGMAFVYVKNYEF